MLLFFAFLRLHQDFAVVRSGIAQVEVDPGSNGIIPPLPASNGMSPGAHRPLGFLAPLLVLRLRRP